MPPHRHKANFLLGQALILGGTLLILAVFSLREGGTFVGIATDSGQQITWTEAQAALNLRVGCPSTPLINWGPCWDDALRDAGLRWNGAARRFRFVEQSPSEDRDPCNHFDRVNTVAFASTICGRAFGGALAVTFSVFNPQTGALLDSDVLFNQERSWATYSGPLQRNEDGTVAVHDFHRVAVHELGHVLGLAHPDEAGQVVTAIMNSRVSNLDSLQSDDIAGMNALYASISTGYLANVSTRGFVGTGDNVLIGGFIIEESAATVLVRAIGPSLSALGVTGALANPSIEVFSGQTSIAVNDDWQATARAEEIPTTLRPANAREAAILLTLPPGAYTAIVRGVGNTTGVALVEVFRL